MRKDKQLDVAGLAVESFVTSPAPTPTQPAPEKLTTCLETNCGNHLCCA